MKGQSNINEEKTTAASYIISFFENVGLITHHYAQYTNLIIELENKYKEVDLKGVTEEEGKVLQQLLQEIRYYAHKAIIQYKSINETLDEDKDKEILDNYDKIKKNYIIQRQDIEAFTIQLNKVLVKDIMRSLLQSSQDIIENIYKE